MKVTGYQLQLQIKDLKRDIDSFSTQFENGKTKFPNEDKLTAAEAYAAFRKAEDQLALVQTRQAVYNNKVKITVDGNQMTLARAIRLVGGAGRGDAMWRSIVAPKKDRFYSDRENSRDSDKIYAEPTYTLEEARLEAVKASKLAAELRQAIQEANASQVEILDSEL